MNRITKTKSVMIRNTFLFSLLLLALPAWGAILPSMPVLVVGPVRSEAKNPDNKLPEMVRTALLSAFAECSEIEVQMDHEYLAGVPEEKIRQLKAIEEMMIAHFVDNRPIDQLSVADRAQIQVFRDEIQTRYLVFGQLRPNPADGEREYCLIVHVVEIAKWARVFPPETIHFSMHDMQTQQVIKRKMLQMIREQGRYRGFCLDANATGNVRTLQELDLATRRLALAEWFFPSDPEIRRQVAEYTQSEVTYEHYLNQKLIVLGSKFREYQRKGSGFAPQLSRELAGHLVGFLNEVIGITSDPLQQDALRAKQRFYQEFLQKPPAPKSKAKSRAGKSTSKRRA